MARFLTFRVDARDGVTRESVRDFLVANSTSHLVCFEISDKTHKPHFQGWIRTDWTGITIGKRMKEKWPSIVSHTRGRGNGHFSCAPVRKATYELYCLKGTATELPDIVSGQLPQGFDLEAEHRKWWSQHASASPKDVHIVEEGITVFTSSGWPADYDVLAKRRDVLEWLLGKYKGRGHNSFLMKNYVNGILNEVCPTHREEFIRQVANADRW